MPVSTRVRSSMKRPSASERVLPLAAGLEGHLADGDRLHSSMLLQAKLPRHESRKEGKLSGSGGVMKAMRLMPRILLFAFWQQFYAYFSGDPFNAFVSTNIACPRPKPPCPVGSYWVGPANLTSDATNPASFNDKDAPIAPEGVCMPVERFHPAWSLSGKCMDKDEVLSKTTRINGLNGWIAAFFSLFAVFIAGQVVDTVGRRPVLICFLSSNIVVKVLLLVSCYLPYGPFFAILVLQNVIEVAFASGVEPALNSMIADRSRGNEDLRGDGFAALGMVMHAADVLAFLAGYPVLKLHLENYTVFWGPLIVVSIVAYIIFNCIPCSTLPETLHEVVDMSEAAEEDEEEEDSVQESFCGTAERCFRALCSETILGFKMVLSDPYLAQFLVIWALILVSMSGSWNLATQYLLGLGYEQANASLARPAWQLSLVLGAAISPHFIRNCSATGAFILALVMMAVGFFWCGTGGHDLEHAELFFWGGTIVLGGVGFGILSPCFSAIISVRVSDKEQGKLFSFVIVMNILAGLGFGQLWPQLFYDAHADDWRKGLPWIASACAFVVLLCWMLALTNFCPNAPQKAESDCGEDTSTDEDAE